MATFLKLATDTKNLNKHTKPLLEKQAFFTQKQFCRVTTSLVSSCALIILKKKKHTVDQILTHCK